MLERIAIIKQRCKNSALFCKPIADPKHGIGSTTEDDAPLMFVPTSLRKKCPIEPSNEFKDHPRMKDRIRLESLDHDAWKRRMACHARETVLLEVALRKEKLGEAFCEYTKFIADSVYIEDKMLGNVPDNRLSDDEYIGLAAYGSIIDVTELQANFLGFHADEGMILNTTVDGTTPREGVVDERRVFSGSYKIGKA